MFTNKYNDKLPKTFIYIMASYIDHINKDGESPYSLPSLVLKRMSEHIIYERLSTHSQLLEDLLNFMECERSILRVCGIEAELGSWPTSKLVSTSLEPLISARNTAYDKFQMMNRLVGGEIEIDPTNFCHDPRDF